MTRVEEHPTSYAQERLWTVTELTGPNSAYHVIVTLRLAGDLDAERLCAAIDDVVARHGALRTGFVARDTRPVQVVHPDVRLTVSRSDLTGLGDDAQDRALRNLLTADVDTPFDLSVAPLARARLVRLAADHHVLLLCVHHIVVDEWSVDVLLRDLASAYAARSANRPPRSAPPDVCYGDYARRQRDRLSPARLAELRAHWTSRLAGAPEVLALPADRPRPPTPSFHSGLVRDHLSAATRDALFAQARAVGATPFMALLAGLAVVLGRNSGQSDVVVGTSVADRVDPAFDDVVGMFVNTLVLRADLGGRPTFAESLARVRDECVAAYTHQDLPFEKLVELLAPTRSAASHPVFQVMMTLQSGAGSVPELPGLFVERLAPPGDGGVPFDLSLSVVDHPHELVLDLRYGTDLFDRATAARLLAQLRVLLTAAAADPHRPVGLLPLTTPAARRALLSPPTPAPAFDRGLPARVLDQAKATPDAVAVSCGDVALSYASLDRWANRLANRLRSVGVGPETLVAVAAHRGPAFVAAVQAVWRAGGAFVPIDPTQPAARQRAVLAQGRCPVVLVDDAGATALADVLADRPGPDRPRLVPLAEREHLDVPATPPAGDRAPTGLAYVIFTSGTTGEPKGAMVTHEGMLNHALAKIRDTGMTAADVLAQNGPATFDVVVWQAVAPLVLGGRIHVVPDTATTDPESLADELARGGVTVLQAVPSTIGLLLGVPSPRQRLRALRCVVSTGDALPTDLADRWLAAHPDVVLLNSYGVTECSDDQYHGTVRPGAAGPVVPIGSPLPHMVGHVLDGELEPSPDGVAGELYLGGLGVGRGYLRRPGLTADRFVPDPHGPPGTRLYRTGDLVRRTADATEFLGRADFQLKVRGFRVEPDEVAAALCGHPAVRAAVAVGRGPVGPDRTLVGYVVPAGEPVALAVLRRFLVETLPDYLVPHQLVWLDELPLTPHGKVDRAALPAPDAVTVTDPGAAAVPPDSIAEVVARVFGQVLGRAPAAAADEFFRIGGTSLLAVELLARLHAASGVRLTLTDLLGDASVLGIAETMRRALRAGPDTDVATAIPMVDRGEPAPASYAQKRFWFIEQLTAVSALYLVPFVVRLSVAVGDDELRLAVDRLLARHEVLRTGLLAGPDGPVQLVAPTVPTPLVIEDLSGLSAPEQRIRVEESLRADAAAGFDLTNPPLLRIRVLRLGGDESLLGFVVHHAVTDAWSNDTLVRDLVELIRSAVAHRPAELPELPIQYLDHSVWQREQLTEDRMAVLTDAWTRRLENAPRLCTLPPDRPRPASSSYRGGTERVQVPADVVAAAGALCRTDGVTTFMVLYAVAVIGLSRLSGQQDLVLGAPVAGRDHPDTRDLVGCFVNTVPLRLTVSGRPTFRELLQQARRICLDAYAHADLPFDVLLDRLRLPREMSHHPVFQVLLALWRPRPVDAECTVLPGAETGAAKFDLTVQVVEFDDRWEIAVDYATDLFDAATVRRFTTGLGTLLAAATAEPDAAAESLPMLDGRQRADIEAWSVGPRVDHPPATLPELVAAQVARTPAAPAVGTHGNWLSYRQFWDAVTTLAGRLSAAGVGPERVVGVCLERGVDLLVAVHAVVAAGGAYVPLEPELPDARLALLVDDTHAAAVICARRDRTRFEGRGVALIDPGEGRAAAGLPTVPVDCLAYVLHTSGSSGLPKGVQVSHRAVVNRLRWMQSAFPVGPGDRVLHKTPFGFDVSLWELFWPLTVGAAVVVAEPDAHRDPWRLCDLIRDERVGTVHFVPSMLGPFLDHVEDGGRVPGLVRVVASGEALTPELVGRFLRLLPHVELHNLYGPTEAAVDVTWQPLPAVTEVVPIGRPVDNTRLAILDRADRPTGVGAVGELHLGGMQLARGYAGRPGQTADRFRPDPDGNGERLYATGDLARWRADGTVEYLGRMDDQVKIRGVRVEPAEAERALRAHPAVAAAAVLPRSGELVAYVVPAAGALTTAELHRHLTARLPVHLVPARYVSMAEFPLTANGKLDRSAFPDPVRGRSGVPDHFVAPAPGPQRTLAEIWGAVLDVARVGAHDNFFDLGGDSIMSLLVVARAAKAGLRITPRQFFEHQSLAALAGAAIPVRTLGRPSRGAVDLVDPRTMDQVLAMLRADDERN